MTKPVNKLIACALLAVAALLGTTTLAQGDTMVLRYRGDVARLDPAAQSSLNDYGISDNIYSQLVRYVPGTSEIVGDLAHSWEVSEDGLTYTFHLREGVQFHRGFGEVTAHDVKWTIDRVIDPEGGSPGRFNFSAINEVEVVDDYTVVLHMNVAHGPLLGKLAYPRWTGIVSQAAIEQYGDQYNFNAVGSGPYVLESWTPGDRIILVANPDYYEEGLPITQRIELVPIADDTVAAGGLETGELALGLFRNPDVIARLEANPNLVVDRTQQSAISGLYYRLDREPFDDPRVAQAVHHAIDRVTLVESVLAGVAMPAWSFIVPLADGATTDVTVYDYDPERARELLVEADYDASVPLVLLSTQLEPWPLVAPLIAFYLEEAGFNIDFRQLEHGTYGSEAAVGNYDLHVLTITGPPDADTWMGVVYSTNTPPGQNRSYYSNPEVDALVDEATGTVDQEARAELYREIQRIAMADAAMLPIFHLGVQLVRSVDIEGFPVPIAHDFSLKTVRQSP